MQSFIVVASLVSELAGGVQNDPPVSPQRYKKHLSPLRVKPFFQQTPLFPSEFSDYAAFIRSGVFESAVYFTFAFSNAAFKRRNTAFIQNMLKILCRRRR